MVSVYREKGMQEGQTDEMRKAEVGWGRRAQRRWVGRIC